MFARILLLLLQGTHSFQPATIRNSQYPVCINCQHFIKPIHGDNNYGRCKIFGEKNIVSGEIEYIFAKHCRETNEKCGLNGIKYEEKRGFLMKKKED